MTINVEISEDMERLVSNLVKSGRYGSATDVVADAMHLLARREQWREREKALIEEGLASAESGDYLTEEEVFGPVLRRLKGEPLR